MALRFAVEGAAVAVNYVRSKEAAAEVCTIIADGGGVSTAVQADVADDGQVRRMVDTVVETFGRIDILVNNAGIAIASSWPDASMEDFDRQIDINVKGVVHASQAVIPIMRAHGGGTILNIASIAGIGTAMHGTSSYGATKAAVLSITRRLAFELGPDRINVNAICPGYIKTDMTLAGPASADPEERMRVTAAKACIGRVGDPEDIANAALFLVSDEASFITGQALTVDGGRTDFLSGSM
jgi:NAD(P)-dependent dehydrogenase (short-subunit alcohol dehydrogenase family)